jgi:hypothetical protein
MLNSAGCFGTGLGAGAGFMRRLPENRRKAL